jgi:hypothetical protein
MGLPAERPVLGLAVLGCECLTALFVAKRQDGIESRRPPGRADFSLIVDWAREAQEETDRLIRPVGLRG